MDHHQTADKDTSASRLRSHKRICASVRPLCERQKPSARRKTNADTRHYDIASGNRRLALCIVASGRRLDHLRSDGLSNYNAGGSRTEEERLHLVALWRRHAQNRVEVRIATPRHLRMLFKLVEDLPTPVLRARQPHTHTRARFHFSSNGLRSIQFQRHTQALAMEARYLAGRPQAGRQAGRIEPQPPAAW